MTEILYKDKHILVCIKPAGVLSENDGMPKILSEELKAAGESSDIFCVHRLDRTVGGIMVYARTKRAAAALSESFSEHGDVIKEYRAAVSGRPEEDAGTYKDLLFKDSRKNRSYTVTRMRRGVREAELCYEVKNSVLYDDKPVSLILIRLKTGRSHQIRVQFSSRRMPLLGDGKYGSRIKCGIGLWSCRLRFPHPITKEELDFTAPPPEIFPWTLFK